MRDGARLSVRLPVATAGAVLASVATMFTLLGGCTLDRPIGAPLAMALPPADTDAETAAEALGPVVMSVHDDPADNRIQLVAALEDVEDGGPSPPTPPLDEMAEEVATNDEVNSDESLGGLGGLFPVDLPTVLQLAGGNSLQVALAAERVAEAYADVDLADAMWIPSLNGGLLYNRHNGRIQSTEGDVREVTRGSLFVGGGLGVGNAPLTGAAGGPARMFVDLSLAEVLFEPLAARQGVDAAMADEAVVFNDTLLEAALIYFELVRAHATAEIQGEAVSNLQDLVKITTDFARAGAGLQADTLRAQAALAERTRQQFEARESAEVASASLVRVLHMDPTTELSALDTAPVAVELVSEASPLEDLIAQGIAARPELAREAARQEATWTRNQRECWRPWLPHLYLGFSGGGFGGEGSSNLKSFSDRTDFDIAAIWELENLGFGTQARRRRWDSRHQQAHLSAEATLDTIAAQVRQAYHRVQLRRQQIEAVRPQVETASRALVLNLGGIRGGELRPIEALQAISAIALARTSLLDATVAYNAAQLELLRAIGQPPHAP